MTDSTAIFKGLALETATEFCSVAACDGDRVACREWAGGAEGSRQIYTRVSEVLAELGLRLADLDCIGFDQGPGGFTGLRVGAAAAQALGYGASLPVCAISSLRTLAAGMVDSTPTGSLVAAALDARMGELYLGLYRPDVSGPTRIQDDWLSAPDALQLPGDDPVFLAGPGWAAFPDLAGRLGKRVTGQDAAAMPGATMLLALTKADFFAGLAVPAAAALPNYVRDRVTR